MTVVLDISYVAAVAIATVYVIIMIGVAARGRCDVIEVMAGDTFAYAMATALAAVIAGRLIRADAVEVSVLVIAAGPFGMVAVALHALGRRDATPPGLRATAGTLAILTASVFPFAMGITGWS